MFHDRRLFPMPRPDPNECIARLLSATELFKHLPPDDLAACAARFHEVHFGKGRVLFARGDIGTHLYVLPAGQVRLAIATAERGN